ncbi:2-succinyl-5-enolpyruvyl-6-hydroxy-3-cyclohexene-1-carboxylic-acid synthase [Micrococcus luteus]
MTSVDSLAVARTVVHSLIDGGMREVVICPGSRSAPLVYALAACERAGDVRLHVRIDERSAAFLAHGLSLGSGRPVGVVTTSGSAVGNLLPGLMESFHSGTRVVALTADRPAEAVGTGANQTTRQPGIFPHHVRFAAVLTSSAEPGHDDGTHLERVRSVVRAALLAADGFLAAEEGGSVTVQDAPSGPVHLNLHFAEPLVPDEDEAARIGAAVPGGPVRCLPQTGRGDGLDAHPPTGTLPDLSAYLAAPHKAAPVEVWRPAGTDLSGFPELQVAGRPERRTVVLAGHGAGPVAAAFATALGLPLFAEPSSNARFTVNAISAYPLLLGAAGGAGAEGAQDGHPLAGHIDRVVLFGRPTLTRPVAALLRRADVETALFVPEPAPWFEPGRRRERVCTTLAELADVAGQGEAGWLRAWQAASLRAQAAVEDVLIEEQPRFGLTPQHTAQICASVVHGPLVLGSSSVIRDVDLTWRPPNTPYNEVYANRGLAGIDGTVSTAAGIALASQRRTVALLGDLTALHDAGGLLAGTDEDEPELDLVVVNDAGGAIFAGLEHGQVAKAPGMGGIVERLFGTPHSVDFEALARAYGVEHVRASDTAGLVHALSNPTGARRLIEVRCDRADRPGVAAALAARVRATFAGDGARTTATEVTA